jgi:oxygen-independent coproporphyrinogen-3 oxidase
MEAYWEHYTNAVVSELILKADEFTGSYIKTIFIGGGTPSLIPGSYIKRILETVHANYKVLAGCETTLESNPGTIDEEKLTTYLASGVNRLSMGLQACQNSLLNKLGRIHTFEDFEYSLNLARKLGFININADIIFGIPGQTFEEWQETISRVLAFDLTHISCYSLMIEEGTVFGRMKDEGLIQEMDEDLDRLMYHYAISEFQKAGFEQYEISNFSKPRYQCEHNMNYWERGGYIGIGAGAHSFIKNRRFVNTSDVARYMEGIDKKKPELSENSILSREEELSEKIILGLRLNRGIDLVRVSEEFQIDAEKKYKKSIALLLSRKLIERDGSVIKLTKLGFDLANTVFVEFI